MLDQNQNYFKFKIAGRRTIFIWGFLLLVLIPLSTRVYRLLTYNRIKGKVMNSVFVGYNETGNMFQSSVEYYVDGERFIHQTELTCATFRFNKGEDILIYYNNLDPNISHTGTLRALYGKQFALMFTPALLFLLFVTSLGAKDVMEITYRYPFFMQDKFLKQMRELFLRPIGIQ